MAVCPLRWKESKHKGKRKILQKQKIWLENYLEKSV